ncbi:TrmH family RNA methyltransferase [Gelidibacter salicanalis]|uniref:TrmH family RNA methyltransferase n=1 Tax=Gelidibacter salicanalis TaxID=291193 RepID=A0A934KRE1_9FLAO|nr:TrmH family RNA methyltransferase [Gelidibacter salicanalis]MBJ7882424.1 TrmH family RNA methyltransferase [Gelidibacter salicanalis]
MQLTHYTSKFTQKVFPITLVCENVTNVANIGSLFRTADAFGLEKILFCGSPIPLGRKMTKTSRATEKYVPYEMHQNASTLLKALKTSGYQIVALEITETSRSLNSFKFGVNQPIALLIGDENFGISDACLKLADAIIHIEMFGQNSSMNVTQATSIALYEITKQLKGE